MVSSGAESLTASGGFAVGSALEQGMDQFQMYESSPEQSPTHATDEVPSPQEIQAAMDTALKFAWTDAM
jgi:hypothetical protein